MKTFLEKIYNPNDTDWMEKVVALRNKIVLLGKSSDKLKRYASSNNKTGDKYNNPKAVSIAGACADEDCVLLYLLVKHFKPKNILEIGTWFGTSAYTMAQAMIDSGIDGKVFTCDKHDLYLDMKEYGGRVEYHNLNSDKFIKKMIAHEVKIDMCFVDARLSKRDIENIVKMFNGPVLYVNHDWYLDKGKMNLKYCKKILKDNADYVLPPEDDAIIVMDDGNKIGYCTYIVCSKGII